MRQMPQISKYAEGDGGGGGKCLWKITNLREFNPSCGGLRHSSRETQPENMLLIQINIK